MRHCRPAASHAALVVLTAGALLGCTSNDSSEPRTTPRAGTPGAPFSLGRDDYLLVGAKGATAFDAPPAQPIGAVGTRLARGFGFLPTGDTRVVGGRLYLRIFDGRWLPEADVIHVRPSRFTGATLGPGEPLAVGWTTRPSAPVFAAGDPRAATLAVRPIGGTRVTLTGPCQTGFCPLDAGWVRAADLARPAPAPRPPGVGPRERWIDVDLGSQTLVAYEGDAPHFATMVATGIGAPGSPFATPVGVFRIRSKHAVVRMDNLEHTGVEPYAYDVPLTQYFSDGKALHAAPWHDRLGHPRSHGCVNLSPADARWLFDFTTPALDPGAPEVVSSPSHPGTVVRVRGQLPAS